MKQAVWTETYKISSFLINLREQAGLYAVLNLIQDVGWLHAAHIGVHRKQNQSWVLTRQKIIMSAWPRWNEEVTINTWIRPRSSNIFTLRDYELFVNGKKIGEGTSTFALFDISTRKILNLDELQTNEFVFKTDGLLTIEPQKIVITGPTEDLSQFQVRNSDMDSNEHMNNTRYAQWILDSIPLDVLKGGVELKSYEVNFISEAKAGDLVTIQRTPETPHNGDLLTQFQGVRQSDNKTVFTAQMQFVAT